MKAKTTFLIVVLMIALNACGPACDVEGYKAAITPIQARWEDAVTLAGNTPRASLSGQISELQAIKRDLDTVEHGECLNTAHDNLKLHYQYTIDGFLEFLAQADDFVVGGKFDAADGYLENYEEELAKLEE